VTAGQKTGQTQSIQLDGGALDDGGINMINFRFDADAVSFGADVVELRRNAVVFSRCAVLIRRRTFTCKLRFFGFQHDLLY